MSLGAQRVALIALAGNALLAGGNGVGIRFSNRELDPLWSAGLRFALAGAVFAILIVALRLPLPRGRALAGALLYGALTFAGAFALAYYALIHLHAGLGQILLALVPLLALFLAVLHRQERLTVRAIAGAVLALAGVAVLSGASLGDSVPLLSVLAALGSALCFAEGAVLVRRFPTVHPVTANAVGMAGGAALLLAGSALSREEMSLPQRSTTWLALAYLVAAGSVVVFALYLVVLRHWAASRAAYVFVVTPIVTVALSAWLDNETVGAGLLAGAVLVLGGVYIGALRPAKAAPTAPEAAPARS
jgi:drug/metabolite transporter (DMT)-like permease